MDKYTINQPRYSCELLANGVVVGLICPAIGSDNLVPQNNGWGCELGNWRGFFSQLKHLKDSTAEIISRTDNEYHIRFNAELKYQNDQIGRFNITEKLTFADTEITQEYVFTVTSTVAKLGDLVNRCVFNANILPQGSISGKRLKHRGQNRYHQYPITDVSLSSKDIKVTVQALPMSIPSSYGQAFQETTYLRDEPALPDSSPAWIIHSRLIAKPEMAGGYIARWFYPNCLLPAWITTILASRLLRPFFWRLRERYPSTPISLGSSMYVAKGDKFIISTVIKLPVKK